MCEKTIGESTNEAIFDELIRVLEENRRLKEELKDLKRERCSCRINEAIAKGDQHSRLFKRCGK